MLRLRKGLALLSRLRKIARLRRTPLVPVHHDHGMAEPLELQGLRHLLLHRETIDIPKHRSHGRDHIELRKDRRVTDVASVEDFVDILERSVNLIAKQAVSIRDETDSHRYSLPTVHRRTAYRRTDAPAHRGPRS